MLTLRAVPAVLVLDQKQLASFCVERALNLFNWVSGSLAKITPADYDVVRALATTQAGVERFGVSLSTAHKHRKRAAVEQAPAESPAKEPPASTAVSASSRLHPRRDASVVAFWWKDDSAQCAVAVSDYGRLGGPGGRLRRISNTTATTMRTMRMRPLPLRAARRAISTRASCPFSNSERCDHTEVAPSAQRLPRALGRRVHRIPQMRKKAPPHPSRMRQGARRNFTLRHDCPNPATLS
jgi:hypothetical protein